MKKLMLIGLLGVGLVGCGSTTKVVYKEKETAHDKDVRITTEKVVLANMQKHGFCEGSKLFSYIETKKYYQFTCNDGRNFMIHRN